MVAIVERYFRHKMKLSIGRIMPYMRKLCLIAGMPMKGVEDITHSPGRRQESVNCIRTVQNDVTPRLPGVLTLS